MIKNIVSTLANNFVKQNGYLKDMTILGFRLNIVSLWNTMAILEFVIVCLSYSKVGLSLVLTLFSLFLLAVQNQNVEWYACQQITFYFIFTMPTLFERLQFKDLMCRSIYFFTICVCLFENGEGEGVTKTELMLKWGRNFQIYIDLVM